MEKKIKSRHYSEIENKLADHPVLQRVYAARGIRHSDELCYQLKRLLPFSNLLNIQTAVQRIALALEKQQSILIVGDYDTDGATSTAIAMRALRLLGAQHVDFIVPDRFRYGYGLSPEIVDLAAERKPDLLITVDNGIVSFDGVDRAKQYGIDVIITDHHLAADTLPDAIAIINPNQPNDQFSSKNLAGCGVIFYVMLALRAHLRNTQWFQQKNIPEPNFAQLLDLVALGTVADMVCLDENNRILVDQGLKRMREGCCVEGIRALIQVGKRKLRKLVASDLGFAVAPRLNAAGRLEDMSIGIECLLADDASTAMKLAMRLDEINIERRKVEASMKTTAFAELEKLNFMQQKNLPEAICLFNDTWHQGVIGILAGRIKDKCHRPTVIFAEGDNGEIKASARSIAGFHVRDALESVHKQHPSLIKKFGGHAMAAGLTIARDDFEKFKQAFISTAKSALSADDLTGKIETDGSLQSSEMTLQFAQCIKQSGPWGQGFPEPMFFGEFVLLEQRIVGSNHLKMIVSHDEKTIDAIAFSVDLKQWPNYDCRYVRLVYRLDVNEFRMRQNLQFMVEYCESIESLRSKSNKQQVSETL